MGKIAIPDAILNKPGKLTPEEYEIMKTHTVQGGALLEKIPQLKEWRNRQTHRKMMTQSYESKTVIPL